jgi:hypothetical protein
MAGRREPPDAGPHRGATAPGVLVNQAWSVRRDFFFGVRAVDWDGNRSPVSFPAPGNIGIDGYEGVTSRSESAGARM